MPKIELHAGENLDRALKRFKMDMRREGTLDEMKKRESYLKPSERRRVEKAEAVRRERKRKREQDD